MQNNSLPGSLSDKLYIMMHIVCCSNVLMYSDVILYPPVIATHQNYMSMLATEFIYSHNKLIRILRGHYVTLTPSKVLEQQGQAFS